MHNKYRLEVVGKNVKRYLELLIDNNIMLYSIKINKNKLTILVDDNGYNDILKIKSSYKIKIVDIYGPKKVKNIIKKYNIFFISIIIGLLLIYVLSNIIFDIKIEHSKSEIREMILNDLRMYGIEKYHFKVNYNKKEEIINKILEKERDRIEWLEIENIGTKYIVSVEERIKNDIKEDNKTQHIIAKKNARILEIKAESGDIVVKKNDFVNKGDILISGFITKDETIKKKVKAIGTVYGEVWYQVDISVPKTYREIKYTNKQKKRIEIQFLNNKFLLFDFKPYKSYENRRKTLLKNKLLPIRISYCKVLETKIIEKRYTNDNKILEVGEEKLKTKLGVNDSIISKKILKKKEKNSKIEVEMFFKVKEDITDTLNIDNIDIEKIGDKNGAND